MSAPTPAPGDDRPREGYYPDPSIPGYVRYWNGASWVPGTSRPAPKDGEPLAPPPGVHPAAPAVEETGPHFFDEDPRQGPAGQEQGHPGGAGGDGRTAWGADPRIAAAGPSGQAARTDGTASVPPAGSEAPDPGGTFIFRRPVPGPAAVTDDGTMTFRPVPGQGRPGQPRDTGTPGQRAGAADAGYGPQPSVPGFGPHTPGADAAGPGAGAGGHGGGAAGGYGPQAPGAEAGAVGTGGGVGAGGGFGPQGPIGAPTPPSAVTPSASSPAAGGPGFGAGKAAAAARAAAAQPAPAARPAPPAPAAVAPSVPAQGGAPATPLTSGPGGGQASWAQQVHQLAGGGDEQPVAPWKPPVEDLFQAAARRQAAARPAGLGKRFAARLIDSLVVGAVTAAAAVPLGTRAVDHIQQKIDAAKLSGREVTVWLLDGSTATSLGIVLAVLLLVGVGYEVLPTAKWGRTLGKKLLGLEVRDIEAHEPPAFGRALRRWLVYSVPGLLGIGIVGMLWCLFDRPWHQCWHDKAAHTFVAG
ncbi:RDD family protein [Streptomyces sp. MMG1121]|uniref:RDD family protein n=1 Tax=Streptomyces sp. MMG1121 TaxID=1415544 RepID=UPI0006AFA4D8|nr:RDD family protein [Streptomyces sp. MMG1121]KOV59149.1 membrane protein [Streptomyces sp. MMG1121]